MLLISVRYSIPRHVNLSTPFNKPKNLPPRGILTMNVRKGRFGG